MRLLEIKGSGEVTLTQDFLTNIPPYAILSHTWGDEEVIFRDFAEGCEKGKKGYRKIQFCGDQAARDGLKYFWVDTCCIDKSNSVELTEAINSMFRWYRNSAKCYVYLPDVSVTSSSTAEQWGVAFQRSRWFTRGWTLQELIAPSSVEFFSESGERLGDRNSMDRRISEITGINVEALRGKPLAHFSVDERMSWAEERMTTREEDTAYSLLGIFEIFMPLIYGEGRQSALERLRKEVNSEPKLPIASGASFDSYGEEHNTTCLENTRVQLQKSIMDWVDNDQGEHVFWLNGMAGTGKSTIARTIAHSLSRRGQLGASFFFKNGENERGRATRFFTTIAADLTRQVPGMRSGVRKAIEADPMISSKALRDQFEKLVLQPLSQIEQRLLRVSALVVVIDALDECDQDEDIRAIIQLISQTKDIKPVSVRIFITSRPEQSIRLMFRQPSSTRRELILHEVPEAVVEHDLIVFFRHELQRITEERKLGANWPGDAKILQLAQMATPLFIFAATACRFIGDWRGNPRRRLETIIQSETATKVSKLDKTYLPILGQLFDVEDGDEEEKEELAREFREVVGPIVLLASPLSSISLSQLLGIAIEDINSRLYSLHSVLYIPEDENIPIRLLHKSFHDFILDPQKCGVSPFWVDERQTHSQIATKCLELISKPNILKRDICSLGNPGASRDEVDSKVIELCLPSEVQYACRYWVHHMEQSQSSVQDERQIYKFLRENFLYWLEALSLMGEMSESIHMIHSLQSLIKSDESTQLYKFVCDANRFLLQNRASIETAPLQVYVALIFLPEKSTIRKIFKDSHAPEWIINLPRVQEDWGASLQALEGHSEEITAMVFSPDGLLVAAASLDTTVRLWDVATGACRSVLESHQGRPGGIVKAITFSPDSKLIATATLIGEVCLWDAATGVRRSVVKSPISFPRLITLSLDCTLVAAASSDGTIWLCDLITGEARPAIVDHSEVPKVVTLSYDGKLIALASKNGTVGLWDTTTGACRNILEGHFELAGDVFFSPDSKLVALATRHNTVQLWDSVTGACYSILKGHLTGVNDIAFSNDNRLIASAASDRTVRLWDVKTKVCYNTLEGHLDWVLLVAFSLDSRLVASASNDLTIRLWDSVTGACYNIFDHTNQVMSIAFSPDSRLVASASISGQVQLWDTTSRVYHSTLDGHFSKVYTVVFSPDRKLVASGYEDGTVRLWDAATGTCRSTLKSDSACIFAIAFSPDGILVASGSADFNVQLWDATTGIHGGTLKGHTSGVLILTFSLDSKLIASVSADKSVRLWNVTTKVCYCIIKGHCIIGGFLTRWNRAVAFSPDGNLVASASYDKKVWLWDTATGVRRHVLEGHSERVDDVAFSPNSKLVASITFGGHQPKPEFGFPFGPYFPHDGKVRLWDVTTGVCLRTIDDEGGFPYFSFSPDGSYLDYGVGQISTNFSDEDPLKSKPSLDIHLLQRKWVAVNRNRVLWIPADFHPFSGSGGNIILGHPSGIFTSLGISLPYFHNINSQKGLDLKYTSADITLLTCEGPATRTVYGF